MEKLKRSNRRYLSRVFTVKTIFYPFMLLLVKSGLARVTETAVTTVIRLFGIRKSARYFFKYRQNAQLFRDSFRPPLPGDNIVLFPVMFGVNSNFNLFNMLLARHLNNRNGLVPLIYPCNAAFGICTRDGMLKPRKRYPWFCHECWKGYTYIEKVTGLGMVYMTQMTEPPTAELRTAESAIAGLTGTGACAGFTFMDMPLGIYARKSVLRYFLSGSLGDTPATLAVYRSFLLAGARYATGFSRLLDSHPGIRYMVVNNGYLLFEAIACTLAQRRGISYMTYETYLGNNSLIYKKNGPVMELGWTAEYRAFLNGFQITPLIREKVAEFFANLRRGVEMYAVLNTGHRAGRLAGAGPYACLFTNLNYDTAVIDRNHTFPDMKTWIMEVISWWKTNRPPMKLVIRVHPGELKLVTASREFLGDTIAEAIGGDENIILFDAGDKVNSYRLIEDMRFALIYSSTIGLEIAWDNKPCLVAGMPWFRDRSFVIYPGDKDAWFRELETLTIGKSTFTPDRDELVKTTWFVYFNRMKRFSGLRLYTPREEPATEASSPQQILNDNEAVFNEFCDELTGENQ